MTIRDELSLKLGYKKAILFSEQRRYKMELEMLEKREERLFRYTLGWATLDSAAGVFGAISSGNALVVLSAICIAGLAVVIGWMNQTITGHERDRVLLSFEEVRKPILDEMQTLEFLIGWTLRV